MLDMDKKFISVKICDSAWHDLPFDEAKLQRDSILITDKSRRL
jgi:hypothetical protein